MAEDDENRDGRDEPMSFEEFQKGPGLLIDKFREELQSGGESAERMARAVQALSDAQGFSALVSICMELLFLRKQLDMLPRISARLGADHLDVYVKVLALTMSALRDMSQRIDPNEVLKRRGADGPEEPPKDGSGTDD